MTVHHTTDTITVHHGSCLDVLTELDDASVDAVITDPPYGLANTSPTQVADTITRWVNGDRDYIPTGRGFMGKAWDAFVPPVAVWDECHRVLKPGGHVAAFAGSRTHDLMTLALRLAGFDIRDALAWIYGSGFPKSLDVAKAIDRVRKEDRAPVDSVRAWLNQRRIKAGLTHDQINAHFGHARNGGGSSSAWMTNPTSRSLPTWEQWNELKTLLGFDDEMDSEVLRLNTRKGTPGDDFSSREVLGERVTEVKGGTWAEQAGGRFQVGQKVIRHTVPATPESEQWQGWGTALKPAYEPIVLARKPLAGTVAANVLAHGTGALNIDGCRVQHNENVHAPQSDPTKRQSSSVRISPQDNVDAFRVAQAASIERTNTLGRWPANVVLDESQAATLDQQSGASTSRAGKPRAATSAGDGWGMTSTGTEHTDSGGASRFFYTAKAPTTERVRIDGTAHPTVKPLDLMRWLVRLITPPGGTILEPFAGSGTTVEAALLEGFGCVAIEAEADYLPLIVQRINRRRDPVAAVRDAGEEDTLFSILGDSA